MRKSGKIFALIAALVSLCFTFAGCSEAVPNYDAYKDERVLNIGAWNGPPNNATTQEAYDDIAASGLNCIMDINSGGVKNKLDYSQNAGIRYIMNGVYFDTFEGIGEYASHPAFMGVIGKDEPNLSEFSHHKERQDNFKSLYPDKLFFINLLPCYATEYQLGTKFYKDYVSEYADTVNPEVMAYDGYSLLKAATGDTGLESGMLFNLETVAVESRRIGKPYWAFLQTMGFGGGNRNVKEKDIRFQYYTYLAYGYSGLMHFCYWTPPGAEFPDGVYGMIDRSGEKTEVYYGVQKVNEEILGFDHVLLSYDWTGTMTVLGENEILCRQFQRLSFPLKEHVKIASAKASQNAIIGTFNDGKYDGFMLVNFTDPSHNLSNKIEVKFNDSKKALVYKNGVGKVVKLKKGVYSDEFAPGEGQFVIPL